MDKEEILRVLRKIEIVKEWYSNMTDGEYAAPIEKAFELIEQLEEVDKEK